MSNFLHEVILPILGLALGWLCSSIYNDRKPAEAQFWTKAVDIIPIDCLVQLFAPQGLLIEICYEGFNLIKIFANKDEKVTSINDLHILLEGNKKFEQVFYVKEAIEQNLLTSQAVESYVRLAILHYATTGKWDTNQ